MYCYITSYIRDPFRARPKKNLFPRLGRELARVDPRFPISMCNSSDPYVPQEKELKLTRRALSMILRFDLKAIIVTKSDLVARDADILRKGKFSVSMTVTTLDERKARRMEPLAPPPSRRLRALKTLVREGVPCSARVDPIIIGYNDEGLEELIEKLAECGVSHVTSSTYKAKPDNFRRLVSAFPELKDTLYELYYEKGELVGRVRYMPKKIRYGILKCVKQLVEEQGMTFAVCREGFPNLNSGESCDGTHLIPEAR